MTLIKTPKKLIEVALPLDSINDGAAREKSIRHGHPSNLHLWWARRPLAAARAVIFAQMVNDPGYERALGRGVNKEKAQLERNRLFKIIEKLVQWESMNDEGVLEEARLEIANSWRETCELNKGHPEASALFNPDNIPAFHDPFAGGGALPLEGQRLGLESFASDLNPVAVLINKAMIEIPPLFAGRAPVGPIPKQDKQSKLEQDWSGATGLAEDVQRYGMWMLDECEKKVGHLYPRVALDKSQGGGQATVIAWIWARTVKSPNPVFSHVDVPLISNYVLCSKAGKEVYMEPVVDGDTYRFEVKNGKAPDKAKKGTKLARGANFSCILSGAPIEPNYIKAEGVAGRIGTRLLAVVAEGPRTRLYVPATHEMESLAKSAIPQWRPEVDISGTTQYLGVWPYGMRRFDQLFTERQLTAISAFSELIVEARDKAKADAIVAGWADDGVSLKDGGSAASAYGDAVATYLAFVVSKLVDINNALAPWGHIQECPLHLFSRQAIAMAWDFAEANPFSSSSGSWRTVLSGIKKGMAPTVESAGKRLAGKAMNLDAAVQSLSEGKVISTDPPYYDNVPYADISDFFYVWLRRGLRPVYPELFASIAVPKAEELVAARHRQGSKEAAEQFFLNGMTSAMHRLAEQAHTAFPTTIYYAFKQSDTTDAGTASTGWETFIDAVIRAGFVITGTWPMRTERAERMRGQESNALASSIVLVCRKRDKNAPSTSRREFMRELKDELAEAVDVMIGGAQGISPVAPVDLAQAMIGPGMAIYSKYSAVLEADGSPMTVHSALTLINRMLTEDTDGFDADTQFCLGWFDEHGWNAGEFGQADVLARAKGTSVGGLVDGGVVESSRGNLRLLKWAELPRDWSPESDTRVSVWESLHHLIRALNQDGETAAGALLARMPSQAEPARALAYRLYTLCERKGWAEEARAYNELVTAWSSIEQASADAGIVGSQTQLDI